MATRQMSMSEMFRIVFDHLLSKGEIPKRMRYDDIWMTVTVPLHALCFRTEEKDLRIVDMDKAVAQIAWSEQPGRNKNEHVD